MNKATNRLRLLFITMMLGIVLSACQPAAPATDSSTSSNNSDESGDTETVLRIATADHYTTMDPIISIASGDITMLGQLYSRLLRVGPDGVLEAALADQWDVSDDKTEYTFHLRDAKFSDGSPITADDVVFSYMRLRDDENSVYAGPFQVIETVEAVDEKTVVFTLDAPAGTFPGAFEIFNAGIVPQAAVEADAEAFARNPVVSGPYMVREWVEGERVVLERNPYYWREGYPLIDVVEFIEVADDAERATMLQDGSVDVSTSVPWAAIDELEGAGFTVPLDPSSVIYIVLLNHQSEALADVNVRKAMALAIDREALTDAVTFGHATTANSLIPNTLMFYDPNLTPISYDPEQARQLLENADAVGTEIDFLVTTGDARRLETTELIKTQLEAVGFTVTMTEVEGSAWWDHVTTADYDASVTWWYNETPDPDLAVRWALCGSCGTDSFYSYYDNSRIDELTELGLREADLQARQAIYQEIQQIALDEVAQIPLYYAPYTHAMKATVQNLRMTPALQWTLEEAFIGN